MSATSFDFSVYSVPSLAHPDAKPKLINTTDTYEYTNAVSTQFNTLFTAQVRGGDNVPGFLYVPDSGEPEGSECNNPAIIPANVTRVGNIPNASWYEIAYAPWISENCSSIYLQAANLNPNIAAMIFYSIVTGNPANYTLPATSSFTIPGGFGFSNAPVYIVDGRWGQTIMNQLARYSGNMSSVLTTDEIQQGHFDVDDVPRVLGIVYTSSTSPMPGLWLFLLIVVAILLFVVGVTSLAMHFIQYRYRQNLRRRVANGEVDLEALGVKRLTVPKEILDKFPISVYIANPPTPSQPPMPTDALNQTNSTSGVTPIGGITNAPGNTAINRGFYQPSCPICLEDFVHQETMVRELPCLHVYHPDCIDSFMEKQSSLCPLCKASALPKGYIPIKLTNAVVRRERILRRSRGRAVAQGLNNNNLNNDGGETGTNIPLQPIATPLAAALAPTGSRRDRLRIPRLGMNRQTVSEEEEAERIRTSKFVCNTSQSHIKENLF